MQTPSFTRKTALGNLSYDHPVFLIPRSLNLTDSFISNASYLTFVTFPRVLFTSIFKTNFFKKLTVLEFSLNTASFQTKNIL